MSFNGSGVFLINSSGQPVVSSTVISATVQNALTADLATGLSNCITKDGQTTITANIPFSTFKITGLGAGTARTDAASLATIQDGTGVYVATVGGTADAITLTPSPAITSYAAGQTFRFIAASANTSTVTLQVSGLASPKAITKNGTTALAANDILANMMVQVTYDGTRFILGTHLTADVVTLTGTQVLTNKTLTSPTINADITTCGLQQNTARLLGRTTASAGAIEELTAGNGLTLSGGSLAVDSASTTVDGILEIATQAEVEAMTDTSRALTANHNKLVLGSYTLASGSTMDFTVPAGVRRVTMTIVGLSTNGTNNVRVRLGDAGGVEATNYVCSGADIVNASNPAVANDTTGFLIINGPAAAGLHSGSVILTLADSATFTWTCQSIIGRSDSTEVFLCGGAKALSAELTTVQLQVTTNSFDLGSVNVLYER